MIIKALVIDKVSETFDTKRGSKTLHLLVCQDQARPPLRNSFDYEMTAEELSKYSIAYSWGLRRLEQKPDGEWVVRQAYDKITTNQMENLTAISEQSVAWLEGGDVWTFNFDSGVIKKVWDSKTNKVQLVDFTYSKATGKFLLNCYDAKGQYLIRFSPATGEKINVGRIGSSQDFVSIVQDINSRPEGWVAGWKRQGLIIVNAQWIDGGPEYAYESYLREMGNWPALYVKTQFNPSPTHVPWSGFVDDFAVGGDSLFFIGSENGGMPGIDKLTRGPYASWIFTA